MRLIQLLNSLSCLYLQVEKQGTATNIHINRHTMDSDGIQVKTLNLKDWAQSYYRNKP